LNYRHAFHAGNFADVVKHLALVAILLHLRKKDAPFAVIDTHAGSGAYDLAGPQAQRTGEAAEGIGRLRDLAPAGPTALSTYLELARGDLYPGSPLVAAKLLRPQDRLVAVEKHPDQAAALADVLRPFGRARVEAADGYARLVALLPPPERRGVVLIDPPYEAEHEFTDAARAFASAFRRFATGTYMIWFPVKSPAEASGFCGEVLVSGPSRMLRLDVMRGAPADDRLSAAGLLIINPPWQFAPEMREALAPILPLLGAQARFETLAGD
jgi:23S rRNA (adenine2030-N6)-methyltransferase